MPKGGCSKTPQQEDFSLSNDMVEKQTGKKDKDKVSLTKTPKLDRSDGGKEVRERATKRKLPFTVGANGEQKDSDTGTRLSLTLYPWRSRAVAIAPVCPVQPRIIPVRARDRPLGPPCPRHTEVHTEQRFI